MRAHRIAPVKENVVAAAFAAAEIPLRMAMATHIQSSAWTHRIRLLIYLALQRSMLAEQTVVVAGTTRVEATNEHHQPGRVRCRQSIMTAHGAEPLPAQASGWPEGARGAIAWLAAVSGRRSGIATIRGSGHRRWAISP